MSFLSPLHGQSHRLLVSTLVVLSSAMSTFAEEPQVIRLAITPATEPMPALKYQLLPKFIDRRPGNAAVRYERAALQTRPDDKINQQAGDWLALPWDEFRQPAVLKQIDEAQLFGIFSTLQLAARLPACDWELPLREQMVFEIVLPELQEMRRLSRYVALKARREIGGGRADEATATLQVGYAMARHAAAGPTLIHCLVGAAIAGMMDKVLLDFAQTPGAPSLYWALSFQPRPLVDPRAGLEAEMTSLFLSFPDLLSVDPKEPMPGDSAAAASRVLNGLALLGRMGDETLPQVNELGLFAAKAAVVAYAAVRKLEMQEFLIAAGWPKPRVEKFNDSELLLAFTRIKFEELRDQQFRWMALPYWQAKPGLKASEERLIAAKKSREEVIPFGALLLPAVANVSHSFAKSERRLDTLRIIEALRLYAGKHDGALPPSLDAVTDVPLPPLDLITGKPFVYALAGKTARLTLPDENRGEKKTLVYEITVQGK